MYRTSLCTGAIIAALSVFLVAHATAEEIKLIFTSLAPTGNRNNIEVNQPWIDRINAASKGTLKIEIRDGFTLANYSNILERVKDDVVQIGFALPFTYAGRFPLSEVAGLPFLQGSPGKASIAFWRLYKAGLLGDEYRDIVPLWFTVPAPAHLHFNKALKSRTDLTGLKINVAAGKIQSDAVVRLGAQPTSIPLQDVYVALQRGTIDGLLSGWPPVGIYKLGEVTTHHTIAGFGSNIIMIFMSREKYNSLPPAARKAIDDNTGEAPSQAFGDYLEKIDAEEADKIAKDTAKHTMIYLSQEERDQWKRAVSPVVDEWASSRPGGGKVLSEYRKILTETGGAAPP